MNYLKKYESPLGAITLVSNGSALTELWIQGQKYDPDTLEKDAVWDAPIPVLEQTCRWLDIYFQGKEPDFTPPLEVEGSEFYRTVSDIMREIPFGKTTTYGAIATETARRLGRDRMSAQAVGGAVGRNAISIIIPCHRVIGAGGNLTGYDGGIDKKIKLLEIEKTDMTGFFVPK